MSIEYNVSNGWRAENQRPSKRIDISTGGLSNFFMKMMPYLVAKRNQAEVMYSWIQHRKSVGYGELCQAFSLECFEYLRDAKKPTGSSTTTREAPKL